MATVTTPAINSATLGTALMTFLSSPNSNPIAAGPAQPAPAPASLLASSITEVVQTVLSTPALVSLLPHNIEQDLLKAFAPGGFASTITNNVTSAIGSYLQSHENGLAGLLAHL